MKPWMWIWLFGAACDVTLDVHDNVLEVDLCEVVEVENPDAADACGEPRYEVVCVDLEQGSSE